MYACPVWDLPQLRDKMHAAACMNVVLQIHVRIQAHTPTHTHTTRAHSGRTVRDTWHFMAAHYAMVLCKTSETEYLLAKSLEIVCICQTAHTKCMVYMCIYTYTRMCAIKR